MKYIGKNLGPATPDHRCNWRLNHDGLPPYLCRPPVRTTGATSTDHVRHYIKNIFSGDSGALSDVNCLFSREYDSRLGYRVAEALRNYVQHRGFQVHSITFNSRWIESEERIKDKLCCSVTPYLQTLELREDSIFKKTILDELEKNLGDKVDVKVIVRDYVEGLYTVHHEIRNKLEPKINYWENSLTSVIDRFREQSSEKENDVWLAAIKRDDDGRWVEQIQIFLDFMNYRKALVQKNSRLGTITRRYVSSEVISD